MKLKQATKTAIIGVILIAIPSASWLLISLRILPYGDWFNYLQFISIIGYALLLPFFITLYKNQK